MKPPSTIQQVSVFHDGSTLLNPIFSPMVLCTDRSIQHAFKYQRPFCGDGDD